MRASLPLLRCGVVWLILFGALAAVPSVAPSALPAQASTGAGQEGLWRRQPEQDGWRVALQFTNYNGDRLTATTPVRQTEVDQAVQEFGYTKSEVDAVFKSCRTCDQAEFDRRVADFYRQRGFAVTPAPGLLHLSIDMAGLVRRNAPRVRALSQEIERIALERRYDASATIGAVLALAQTGLEYFSPPMQESGRDISGLYVPPQVLATGRGDCDSKTALVASILKNFSGLRLIGVAIPNHYLMGVSRIPQRGDAYVEYAGEPYVLLEPAGPGWLPPGQVGSSSLDRLRTMRDVRLDPFH